MNLVSSFVEGYFVVPGYSNYAVSKVGEVMNLSTLMLLISTGELLMYESAVACSNAHGVNPTALSYRLAHPDKIFGGLKFEYYRQKTRSAT